MLPAIAIIIDWESFYCKLLWFLNTFSIYRAALTSGRTTANGIYCPPKLQAALDLQSGELSITWIFPCVYCIERPLVILIIVFTGVLHAADEKDFKTAFSYFYEAFEGYDSIDNPKALTALKYMLMCKIMLNKYVLIEILNHAKSSASGNIMCAFFVPVLMMYSL